MKSLPRTGLWHTVRLKTLEHVLAHHRKIANVGEQGRLQLGALWGDWYSRQWTLSNSCKLLWWYDPPTIKRNLEVSSPATLIYSDPSTSGHTWSTGLVPFQVCMRYARLLLLSHCETLLFWTLYTLWWQWEPRQKTLKRGNFLEHNFKRRLFRINQRNYLAVANYGGNMVDSVNYPNKQTKYHVESIIYEYNTFTKQFERLQTIQTDGYVMIPLFFNGAGCLHWKQPVWLNHLTFPLRLETSA